MLWRNKTDVKIWNEDFKDDATKDIVEHDRKSNKYSLGLYECKKQA